MNKKIQIINIYINQKIKLLKWEKHSVKINLQIKIIK